MTDDLDSRFTRGNRNSLGYHAKAKKRRRKPHTVHRFSHVTATRRLEVERKKEVSAHTVLSGGISGNNNADG